MKTLGNIRREKGYTQSSLGKKVGVTQRSIASYESGTRRPSPAVAERIAQALGMDVATMWVVLYTPKRRLPPFRHKPTTQTPIWQARKDRKPDKKSPVKAKMKGRKHEPEASSVDYQHFEFTVQPDSIHFDFTALLGVRFSGSFSTVTIVVYTFVGVCTSTLKDSEPDAMTGPSRKTTNPDTCPYAGIRS